MRGDGTRVAVSAQTGDGLDTLLSAIEQRLAEARSRVTLRIPQSEAGLVTHVHESGHVLERRYEDNMIVLEAEVDRALQSKLSAYISTT